MIVVETVVVVPGTAVASPFEPVAVLTLAIVGSDEVQVANVVRFCWVLFVSDSVPVAVNCKLVAGAMVGATGGATIIDATCAVVSVVDPVILPVAAVIMVVPVVDVAIARPCEPGALLTFAIPVSDEPQVTDVVIFRVLLFE